MSSQEKFRGSPHAPLQLPYISYNGILPFAVMSLGRRRVDGFANLHVKKTLHVLRKAWIHKERGRRWSFV